MSTPPLELPELSDIIGAIYDCALAPGGWSDVLRRICGLVGGNTGALYLIDFVEDAPRLFAHWGMPEEAVHAWQSEFAGDVSALHARIAGRGGADLSEPSVYSRMFSEAEREAMRVHREWARPLGICDVIAIAIAPSRIGMLVATRHDSVGLVTEREHAVMRLLAPHV